MAVSLLTPRAENAVGARSRRPRPAWWRAIELAAVLALPAATSLEAAETPKAGPAGVELAVEGPISAITADYLARELRVAAREGAPFVILTIDTPGGQLEASRAMAAAILASPVPVIAWTAPRGARAASAGTFLLYASHVAAMAPTTTLGAATPVTAAPAGAGVNDDPAVRKAVNDTASWLRTLAELHGRNADWAEDAVRNGASIGADDALARGVVDLLARDRADLLEASHGRTVVLGEAAHTLETRGVAVVERPPDWRTRVLSAIAEPTLAFALMIAGTCLLAVELFLPGALVPGVLGGVALLAGLYGSALVPVAAAGTGLTLIGIGATIAAAATSGFGVLALGALAAVALGATMLLDIGDASLTTPDPLVVVVTLAGLTGAAILARILVGPRRRPARSGAAALLGAAAQVADWAGRAGHVRLHGRRWKARAEKPLNPGARVRVLAVEGLTLRVAEAEGPPRADIRR